MTYKINFESYKNNFTLPDEIAGDDLKTISGDYLKIILLIFKNSDRNYSVNLISSLLDLEQSDVQEAINYWVTKGLLISDEKTAPPTAVVLSKTAAAPKKTAANAEVAFIMQYFEEKLKRPITSVEYKTIIHILEYLKMPADVVIMAAEYCISINKMNMRYFEKVCTAWAESGINSHDLAEQYLNVIKKSKAEETKIKKLFGVIDRELIDNERACIQRWLTEYKFSFEMIKLAYEKTIKSINKASFPYANKILQSWHEKGYTAVKEVNGETKSQDGSSCSVDDAETYWNKNIPKLI